MWLLVRARARGGRGFLSTRLLGLGLACALALAVIGIELLPAIEFTGQTARREGGRLMDIYAYGLHPARLIELLWPNVFGRPFGVNRSWLTMLPPTYDHRIWITSLYLGGMTGILAIGAVGFRGCVVRGWLTAVLAVSLLASLGSSWKSVRLARNRPQREQGCGATRLPGSAISPPGRRPQRWRRRSLLVLGDAAAGLPLVPLSGKAVRACLSLRLRARGDGLGRNGRRSVASPEARGRLRVVGDGARARRERGGVGEHHGVLARSHRTGDHGVRTARPRSKAIPFGHLRAPCLQAMIVSGLLLVLCYRAPRRPVLAGVIALGLMSVDLAIANRSHVGNIAQSVYDQEPRVLAAIKKAESDHGDSTAYRVYRIPNWSPLQWNLVGSPDRLREIVRWERDSLRPKYGLPYGVDSTFVYGTAELVDHGQFFVPRQVILDEDAARELGTAAGQRAVYFPRRGFDLWNTKYFVLPTRPAHGSRFRGFSSFLPDTELIYPDATRPTGPGSEERLDSWSRNQDLQVLRNLAAYPRAWVVHRARVIKPTAGSSANDRARVMDEILYQDDILWSDPRRDVIDPHRVAWIEAGAVAAGDMRRAFSQADANPSELPRITSRGSEFVALDVNMRSAGLLVLADVYYPDWTLTVDGQPRDILCVNRMMRGALLSAGKHHLIFRYRPQSVYWGAVLSILGIGLLGAFQFWAVRTDRATRNAVPAGIPAA